MKRPWATPTAISSWDDGDLASFADEVGALLRSAPDDGASATRAAVLSAFAAAAASGALGPGVQPARRMSWARRPASGLAGLAGAAAMTVVIGAGMVAASTPGGVLYDTRVTLEAVALPSDPDARDDAQVDRLGRRLGEMANAASTHDAAGTLAALQAFTRIADTAALEAGQATPDPDAAQRVLAQVERLAQLAAGQDNPDAAWDAAIAAGRRLAAALTGGGTSPGAGASASPGASPAPGGSQGANQGAGASGASGEPQGTGGTGPGASGNASGTEQRSPGPGTSATPAHDGGQGPSASSGTGGSGPGASQAPGGNGSANPTGSPSASPATRTPQPTGSGGPAGSGGPGGSGSGSGPGSTGGPTG